MSVVHVLGNATIDYTLRLAAVPAPGETILADSAGTGPGGKGLNQAVAAARAGTTTRLVAPVGRDANAVALHAAAAGEPGLDAEWLSGAEPTDISTIWVTPDGDNRIASSAASARSLTPEGVGPLLSGLAAADSLLLQGNLRADATVAAARTARAAGYRIIVNPAPVTPGLEAALALADLVIANATEAAQLTGAPANETADRLAAMAAGTAIVTQGAQGATVVTSGRAWHIAPEPVVVADTSGAGDVFAGVVAAALAEGADLETAAGLASRAAGLSVSRPGTISSFPTRDELAALR